MIMVKLYYNYFDISEFVAVMNEYGKLEETVEKVMAIIEAEKSRTSRLFVTGETHPKEK